MSNPASNLDFALLQRSVTRHGGARNRITLLWLLGLLVFLAGAVVTLVLYLQRFEADEAARQRVLESSQAVEKFVRQANNLDNHPQEFEHASR